MTLKLMMNMMAGCLSVAAVVAVVHSMRVSLTQLKLIQVIEMRKIVMAKKMKPSWLMMMILMEMEVMMMTMTMMTPIAMLLNQLMIYGFGKLMNVGHYCSFVVIAVYRHFAVALQLPQYHSLRAKQQLKIVN